MKLLLTFLLIAINIQAQSWCTDQTPCKNYLAAGISVDASTRLATETALYAREFTKFGTNWVTFSDFIPVVSSAQQADPKGANTASTLSNQYEVTSLSTGFSQRLFQIGSVSLHVPLAAGFSTSEKAIGWAFTSGLMLKTPYIDFNARILKSSINNYTGYTKIFGVTFGIRF